MKLQKFELNKEHNEFIQKLLKEKKERQDEEMDKRGNMILKDLEFLFRVKSKPPKSG